MARSSQHLRSQTGAAIVFELILLALVLGVGGLAIYNYYQNKQAANPAVAGTPHRTSPSPSPTPSASPTSTNLLQIPELGIEMTLPAGLTKSDVYYVTSTTTHTYTGANGKPYQDLGDVVLSTHSLAAMAPNCAAKTSDGTLTGLIGLEKTNVNVNSGYQVASPNTDSVQVGNFYMSIWDRQSFCSPNNNNLENAQYNLFVQAYSTIKPL